MITGLLGSCTSQFSLAFDGDELLKRENGLVAERIEKLARSRRPNG